MAQNHRERILALLKKRQILRARDLTSEGIPRSYLSRLVEEGVLLRSGRGIYFAADTDFTAFQSLAEVAQRIPHSVICLLSALQVHELTTEMPHEVWIAISRTARIPKVDYPAVRAVRFSDTAFKYGVEKHNVGKTEIQVYSAAKTVVDCFKYRNKIGIDVATQALRDCWQQRKATMDELWEAAKVCRMSNVMRPYMESMT
ncbi:MAG: AbiEi antitoxin N-terminal domain-containing protein [Planctomycetes bacterium]|nr:AbiEi antitoxin N-terminal domain-containing protein [Planctomycetota bacterium]